MLCPLCWCPVLLLPAARGLLLDNHGFGLIPNAAGTVRGLTNTPDPTKGRGSTEGDTAKIEGGRKQQLLMSLSA